MNKVKYIMALVFLCLITVNVIQHNIIKEKSAGIKAIMTDYWKYVDVVDSIRVHFHAFKEDYSQMKKRDSINQSKKNGLQN